MIIKNHLRPTTIRTNSRFRGPTELGKYTNFILESVHDMKLLGSVMDRNEFIEGHKGQTDYIQDNFVSYVNGGRPITSNIQTASTLYSPGKDVFDEVDLMSTDWTASTGCTKSTGEEGVVLTAQGVYDPEGIARQLYVEEGDIIYIRVGVRVLSGETTTFTLGSHDMNQGEGDIKKFEIPKNGSTIYVDKRLYCKHREPISINIDVHNVPDILEDVTVEVVAIQICYLSENQVTVQPVNTIMKSKVNTLQDQIKNMINNV